MGTTRATANAAQPLHLAPHTYFDSRRRPGPHVRLNSYGRTVPVARTVRVVSGSARRHHRGRKCDDGLVVSRARPHRLEALTLAIHAERQRVVRHLGAAHPRREAGRRVRISPNVKDVVTKQRHRRLGPPRTGAGAWKWTRLRAECSTPPRARHHPRNRITTRARCQQLVRRPPAGPQAITISYCGGNHVTATTTCPAPPGTTSRLTGDDNFTDTALPPPTPIYANNSHAGMTRSRPGANRTAHLGQRHRQTAIVSPPR